jgi:hypothetical protein
MKIMWKATIIPNSTFNGTINEPVDLTKDGTYNVTATGKLTVHGVEKEPYYSWNSDSKGGTIDLTSDFDVTVADHSIKIPTVVVKNIAEVVKVNVKATMAPSRTETK